METATAVDTTVAGMAVDIMEVDTAAATTGAVMAADTTEAMTDTVVVMAEEKAARTAKTT
ncbi:hypothetical protein [Microvirga roseola]|uniref:hypothetical protein n=1 Tax=Microvirga roseola TaxID=2883126 RepID=UPI001E483361|nr:hypothetical protein [Microvirga roseola]